MLRDVAVGALTVIILASLLLPDPVQPPYDLSVVASINTGCGYHAGFLYIDSTTVYQSPTLVRIGPDRDLIPGITTPTPQYVVVSYNSSEITTLHNPRHIRCVLRTLQYDNVVD
jgi:hypothetical protein